MRTNVPTPGERGLKWPAVRAVLAIATALHDTYRRGTAAYGGIQIRPMIPPTFHNRVFSRAGQRVHRSATLGSGGELERASGRFEITRMPLHTKTPPRSRRRLFVFRDLVKGGDAPR